MRQVKLEGVEYPVFFGIKTLHDFAKAQGIDDVQSSLQSLAFLQNFKKGHKLTITEFEKVSVLATSTIKAGLRKQNKPELIDEDFIYEQLFINPEAVGHIINEVVDGLNEFLEHFAGGEKKKEEQPKG